MKAFSRRLVLGLLVAGLTARGVALLAAPPGFHPSPIMPHPHGAPHGPAPHGPVHHGPVHHGPAYHGPVPYVHHHAHPIIVTPRPVVVLGATVPVSMDNSVADDSNAAPVATPRLVNPIENKRALRYTVNGGAVRTLSAGRYAEFNAGVVVRFDRGSDAGQARYVLEDGSYSFRAIGGLWSLVHDGDDDTSESLANIAPNPTPGT